MTIICNCPHCNKLLTTSDDRAGRQAKCPGCGQVITIPRAQSDQSDEVPESTSEQPGRSDSPPPIPGHSEAQKVCPNCHESVREVALRCSGCGYVFEIPSMLVRGRPDGFREIRPFPPGDVISEAWRIFSSQVFMLIGYFLAMSLLTGTVYSFAWVMFAIGSLLYDSGNEIGAYIAGALGVVGYCVAVWFTFYMQAGYLIVQIKAARERPYDFNDLFSGGPFAGRLMLNSILYIIVIGVGTIACFVPGLLLGVMFWPFGHLLVDKNDRGIDSLVRSKDLTDGNWGSLFLVLIIWLAALMMGAALCQIGLIVTIPFANLLLAVAYDRMSCQTPLDVRKMQTKLDD